MIGPGESFFAGVIEGLTGDQHQEQRMANSSPNSSHGIVRDEKGQEQPADKRRARTAHTSEPENSASREATREHEHSDIGNTPGSGKTRK